MAKLRKPVFNFLNKIFEPTRYHANATLRGFYFTSGTQEGTPIDQLIGALSKTFGAQGVQGAGYSGKGRSYFLTDLIGKVIIGEAAWVSTDRAALRRQRILAAAAYSALFLVCAGASAAWWTSYTKNRTLIDETVLAVNAYKQAAGPIAQETVIADRDFTRVLPLLHKLHFMPVGYASREQEAPLAETFGLSQRARLLSVSEDAYRIGLERQMRPRLIYRLEEQFEQNRTNPGFLYEALKVYLMIGGERPPDKKLVLAWIERDFEDNLYPGAANAEGREALLQHAKAMLDLQSGQLMIGVNGALVEDAQNTLARLSIAQRAYELMKSQARSSGTPDWIPARVGGQDFRLVFDVASGDTLESLRVPGFYTWLGFHRDFIGKLPGVAEQLKAEQWVLGAAGKQQAVAAQYENLPKDLLALYAKDFVAIWKQTLLKLRMKRLTADKPKYVALASVTAATSPLKKVIESIRDETALTRERADLKKAEEKKDGQAGMAGMGGMGGAPSPALLGQAQNIATPGADIEAEFKEFHALVDGDATRRPVDAMVGNLADIYQSLLMATNPSQQQQATAQLNTQVAALRSNANRFPKPFNDMMLGAANELDGDLTNVRRIELNRILAEQVTGPCETIISNRFPFFGADREVPLAEFGRLFGVNGLMDTYFKQHLQPLVDTSKATWNFRVETPLGRALAQSTTPLREFQRAQEIRETFFAAGGVNPSMSLTVLPPALPFVAPVSPTMPAPPPPGGPAFSFGDQSAQAQPLPQPVAPPSVQYRFDVNGTPVVSQQGAPQPAVVQWPGAGGRSAIVVQVEGQAPGRAGARRAVVAVPHDPGGQPVAARRPAGRQLCRGRARTDLSDRRRHDAQPVHARRAQAVPLPLGSVAMPAALYGKTQSKRDFVAPGAPRAFLDRWEPWMQAGLASSRLVLDRAWQERFLTAPIWRFWLGEAICGTTLAGAFMPSLDAIGRYYPLAVFSGAPAGLAITAAGTRPAGELVRGARGLPPGDARSGDGLGADRRRPVRPARSAGRPAGAARRRG
jgi:type VI secretion system protein ImpL